MTLAKYNILWELKEGISLPWEVIRESFMEYMTFEEDK